MNKFTRTHIFAYIILILAMLLYSTTYMATKTLLYTYSPAALMTFRMAIAALVFLPFYFVKYKDFKPDKHDYTFLWIMALFEPCLYFVFEANGLRFTTTSQAGIISCMDPIFVVMLARAFLKERMPIKTYLGFLVAIIGAVVLSLSASVTENAPNPMLGNTLQFCASFMTATSVVATKHLMKKYSPFFLVGFQVTVGTVFFTLLNLFQGGSFVLHLDSTIVPLLYLGVLTILAYALYNYSMRILTAARASAFMYLLPVFAVLIGVFVLHEELTHIQILAGLVIFLGIFIIQRNAKRNIFTD